MAKRTWVVGGRYGYFAVDEYHGTACIRTTVTGVTRKVANIVAGACTDAYEAGVRDASQHGYESSYDGGRKLCKCGWLTPLGLDGPASIRAIAMHIEEENEQ